jgi:pimeloyl-ACP methyl ester carboxylesterase
MNRIPPLLPTLLFDSLREWPELGATLAVAPWLRLAPRGDGDPVLLIPGLFATDASMSVLHAYLHDRGWATYGWEQGLNVGRWEAFEPLLARFDAIHAAHDGRRVGLVGWSMGGLYARELARARPHAVSLLVQLATPFGPAAGANNNWFLYELASGQPVEAAIRDGRATPRPPVPTVSIYSRSDGHVAWANCVERDAAADAGAPLENVEVVSSHQGMRHHPRVLWTVATRLAAAPR